jgi:hypothetical protein
MADKKIKVVTREKAMEMLNCKHDVQFYRFHSKEIKKFKVQLSNDKKKVFYLYDELMNYIKENSIDKKYEVIG